ncbi:hypothetical protein ACQP2F_37295 [Actinoplanes sp. CA-030573]|uniref:hypothetical protein n=1 Tax=Actinoplanes sp. CA-030573 TaxID=3239898 RepID=UPI003D8A66EF
MTGPGASDTNRYIQRVRVNGHSLTRSWIPWSAIASGGAVAHTVGDQPSSWRTAAADQPPSVNRAPADDRTRLDASLRPASAALPPGGSATLTVDIVGQAPGVLFPRVSATAPAGWTVSVEQLKPIVSRPRRTSTCTRFRRSARRPSRTGARHGCGRPAGRPPPWPGGSRPSPGARGR